jgi:hypothetical protein
VRKGEYCHGSVGNGRSALLAGPPVSADDARDDILKK